MNPPKNEQEKNAKNENAAAKVGIPLVLFFFSTYRSSNLIVRYNDKAVLEMHHVAAAYTLIHSMPAFGIFNGMELSV